MYLVGIYNFGQNTRYRSRFNHLTIFLDSFFLILYEGDCSYGPDESMGREVGSKFRRAQHLHRTGKRGVSEKVQALKYFLESYNLHVGLSLEGEGQFIRLPYDDEGRYSEQRPRHTSAENNLMALAKAYLDGRELLPTATPSGFCLFIFLSKHKIKFYIPSYIPAFKN